MDGVEPPDKGLRREQLQGDSSDVIELGSGSCSCDGTSPYQKQQQQQPRWVRRMNGALELNAATTLLAFVILDMGSGLLLWGLYAAIGLGVDADFALAYAISKALRAPRLALDASAAAVLTRIYPPLASVRICLIVDAAVSLSGAIKATLTRLLMSCWPHGCRKRGKTSPPEAKKSGSGSNSRSARAAAEARRLADTYGLALMAAKNFIGPVSIMGIYIALRAGLDVQGWLASLEVYGIHLGGTGKMAGLMAAASWTSTLLFPMVVMGAAELGPVIHRAAQHVLGPGHSEDSRAAAPP